MMISSKTASVTVKDASGLSVTVEHKNMFKINMPTIMSSKEGSIEKWLKKEGEPFHQGEQLCEVTLDDLTVALDAPRAGVLAEILLYPGKLCKVDEPIALYCESNEDYLEYINESRVAVLEAEMVAQVTEQLAESAEKPSAKTMLREIRHLIQTGAIVDGSEFAKKLQSLARKGDADLLAAFEASFEGSSFNLDTFDSKFFLDNAKSVIEEKEEEAAKAKG